MNQNEKLTADEIRTEASRTYAEVGSFDKNAMSWHIWKNAFDRCWTFIATQETKPLLEEIEKEKDKVKFWIDHWNKLETDSKQQIQSLQSKVEELEKEKKRLEFYKKEYTERAEYDIKELKSTLSAKEKEMYLNMQYYYEYIRHSGYVTPQIWIEKHKHF